MGKKKRIASTKERKNEKSLHMSCVASPVHPAYNRPRAISNIADALYVCVDEIRWATAVETLPLSRYGG